MKTDLSKRLKQYKRRYYLNLILRGSIIAATIILSAYLFINFIEYKIQSGQLIRSILFFGYILLCLFVFYKWLLIHILPLFVQRKQISDEKAALNIGNVLPAIGDKLLNLVQLNKQTNHSLLLSAAIDQKAIHINPYAFESVIDFRENVRYLKYLITPFVVVLGISVFFPSIITEPTTRIIHFRQDFSPQMPFSINVVNKSLIAFKNEDFTLELETSGNQIPESVYILVDNRKIQMKPSGANGFYHLFGKMQQSTLISFEAAGYRSENYEIEVVNRPNLKEFSIQLNYPKYLNKPPDRLENTGDFRVPEGTKATWLIKTTDTEEIAVIFNDTKDNKIFRSVDNQIYTFEKTLNTPVNYSIELKNKYSENKEAIQYNVQIIPDEFPEITLEQILDTLLYKYIVFGGIVTDDYGLSKFDLYYKGYDETAPSEFKNSPIPIDQSKNNQSFYYQWDLSAFDLMGGETIEYYLQITDNDEIHGLKSTKTPVYKFKVPSNETIQKNLEISSQKAENQLNKIVEDSKKLNEELKEIENKFKGKKELNWQDKKQIEELIKRKETLEKVIKELQENFQTDNQRREQFEKEVNPTIKEKLEQLQKLIDELLDDETKKLYEELQKLLDEQKNPENLKSILEKLSFKEENLEKELERTLELFKKMKFEMKLEVNIQSSQSLEKKQEKAAQNSDEKSIPQESKISEQEDINKEFEELKEDLKEMQEMNQQLEHPSPMEDMTPEMKSIEKLQKEAIEQLNQEKNKNAGKTQQGASDALKKLSEKLQNMQNQMMQSTMQMNMGQLRDILDNLIKLSFQQESIMDKFREVNQSDPRFIELSQAQLKIKEDALVIQDSLISLSKQDFRIQSIVTRKVDEMNRYFDESVEAMKERKKGDALSGQQFAMATVNDLALMLDDVLSQMMNAMGSGGGQPQNVRSPSMSELQQQLSDKIEQLKKSGKSGRQLSEELAKMAAEQEMIRQMLSDLEEEMGENGSGEKLDELREKMEQNELDLVNKQLTDQLIQRQKDIMTRLLEAENAQRERELDEEREGERAGEIKRTIPLVFEDYFKEKEKEIELLKTIPPRLNPYYKKEVNQYFKRIE